MAPQASSVIFSKPAITVLALAFLVSNPSAAQATAPPRAEAIRAQLLGRQRWGVVCRLITRPPAEAKRVQPMA